MPSTASAPSCLFPLHCAPVRERGRGGERQGRHMRGECGVRQGKIGSAARSKPVSPPSCLRPRCTRLTRAASARVSRPCRRRGRQVAHEHALNPKHCSKRIPSALNTAKGETEGMPFRRGSTSARRTRARKTVCARAKHASTITHVRRMRVVYACSAVYRTRVGMAYACGVCVQWWRQPQGPVRTPTCSSTRVRQRAARTRTHARLRGRAQRTGIRARTPTHNYARSGSNNPHSLIACSDRACCARKRACLGGGSAGSREAPSSTHKGSCAHTAHGREEDRRKAVLICPRFHTTPARRLPS